MRRKHEHSRIQFGNPDEIELPLEKLPPSEYLHSNSQKRNIERQPFLIYFLKTVLDDIWAKAAQETYNETGGILVGQAFRNIDNPVQWFSVISGFIPQVPSQSSAVEFSVDTAEIARTREQLETFYPGYSVVGWYHTHTGHGVFLSASDMMIVKTIYNAYWHITLILDPHKKGADAIGFFVGPEGTRKDSWLELEKKPKFVEIYAAYQRAIAANRDFGDPEKLVAFANYVLKTKIPELEHWRQKGIYQALNLNAPIGFADSIGYPEIEFGPDAGDKMGMYRRAQRLFTLGVFGEAYELFDRLGHYELSVRYREQIMSILQRRKDR